MDITGALAIVLIFGGGTLFLLAISPVGRAIAERIRRPGGGALPEAVRREPDELRSALTGEVHQLRTAGSVPSARSAVGPALEAGQEEVATALEELRREVAELAERVDFTERLLAKNREGERLGPPR